MVDAFATMALETLRDLLIEEAKFLSSVDGQVEEVCRQLKTMHSFLKDADKRRESYDSETVRNWVLELRDLSVQTENVLERYAIQVTSRRGGRSLKKILKRFTCILCEISDVHEIGTQIQEIRSRMTDLTNRAASCISKFGESSSSTSVDHDAKWSRPKTYGNDVEQHFVGMNDDVQLLQSLVTSDERSNRVISICGMGGLGKTTLATKIYNEEAVQRCFEVRAWVCVSQQFELKAILQQVLKQLDPNQGGEQSEDELVRKLHKVQSEKRCLVVLDDIWEVDHWNSLKCGFPINPIGEKAGCKVLLTSRNENIAATETESYVHKLQYLSEDEGWELLQKIALPINQSKELPTTDQLKLLEGIGREIIRQCGCLPLAISVIGGILLQERTSNGWEKVRKNIYSYLQQGDGLEVNKKVTQVLDLSYNVLPYNLKPCFLYLGCFPEDRKILTEELYLLWMAGGMISSRRKETLREAAERYLCELAKRCMVQVIVDESSTSNNRFKWCRLHDLMRDLCLLKGKEEGLLEVIDKHMGTRDAFSGSWLAVHMSDPKGNDPQVRPKKKGNEPQDNINKYKNLRSLLFFSNNPSIPSREWNNLVSIDFGLLKSLKILKLEGCRFVEGKLPKGIEKLILLKHLSIFGSVVDELPSYVCKLPCVQSLDFRPYCFGSDGVHRVHNSIYKMSRLRHLFLEAYDREVIGCGKLKFDGLNELETLIGFNSRVDDITQMLQLTKLRVLNGNIHNEDSLSAIVDHIFSHQGQFWNIEFTIQEECNMMNSEGDGGSSSLLWKTLMCHSISSLDIRCRLNKLPSYEPELGRNLIELSLRESHLSEDPMEVLEQLPELRTLDLYVNSFEGREMVCKANGFPQLNSLELMVLPNLVEWRVEEKAMPKLSKLQIFHCEKLEMIPEGLKFITTLKELTIPFMPKEFADRVRVVDGQEGEDYHKIKHIPSINIYGLL